MIFWIAAIAGMIIFFIVIKYPDRYQLSDTFCPTCGCPIIKKWYVDREEFDRITGEGKSYQTEYAVCSNKKRDNNWYQSHYEKKTGRKEVRKATPECT